jgi:hypothetical protein
MSVKAPLQRILAGLLVACTLVALWATGARVKAAKMAARYGDRISSAPIEAGATSTVTLPRGKRVKVAHFDVEYSGEAVRIFNSAGTAVVEFPALRKGERRGWQELQMTFVEISPEQLKVEVDFKPGSACFGSGRYRALKQGLRIQFPGDRSVTIATWDAAKPEATLHLEGPAGKSDSVVNVGAMGEVFQIRYRFEKDSLLDLTEQN